MIDQATRNYVQSVVDSAPVRQGSIDSVIVRGRRRRSAMRIGTAASVAAVLLLAAGMTAWLRPVAQPVASGSDPVMLELPSGFAVGVEPETVESQGAIIYVGLRGPEPVFDTADLGSEIGIVRRPATDLIVPPSDDLLERNA